MDLAARAHAQYRPAAPAARPSATRRDPYDGLRPWSAITHGIGALLAIFGTALLLTRTALTGGDAWRLVSFSIYGASMICLYTASTLYHSVRTTVAGRIALRKFDHISIFFLIAGSYTPVCLTALRATWGWPLFGSIWALALLGTALTLAKIDLPRQLTAAVYIAMGWLAAVAIRPIWVEVGNEGLFWLLLGGVLYTVGGVLYALKWPRRDDPRFGSHEIFHVFIVLGSIAHYMLMYRVIM